MGTLRGYQECRTPGAFSCPYCVSAQRAARLRSGKPEGLRVPPPGVEMAAVLAVAGGVLGRRKQQAIAVRRGGVAVVVEQAGAELLVVWIVARLGRAHRERLDERGAVESPAQIGRRPVHRFEGAQPV